MATAIEKFGERITNAEYNMMSNLFGVLPENWEGNVGGIDMMSGFAIVASKRVSLRDKNHTALTFEDVSEMTPQETSDKLTELVEALGFADDPDEEAAEQSENLG